MPVNPEFSDAAVARLARRQLADYDSRSPGALFGERREPLGADEGYRIQLAMAQLRRDRGEPVAGFKIGCVSKTIQHQLGVDSPVFGHVFRSEVRTSPAILSAGDFCQLAIEGEFATILARGIEDLEELAEEPSRFAPTAFPVIELHNYVFLGPKPYAGELIANNALNAGIVVPPLPTGRPALEPVAIRVSIGGRVDDCTEVDPLGSLHDLASILAVHGIRPRAGDILLTGSPLPLYPVSPGDTVRVACEGLADVSATVRSL